MKAVIKIAFTGIPQAMVIETTVMEVAQDVALSPTSKSKSKFGWESGSMAMELEQAIEGWLASYGLGNRPRVVSAEVE